MTDREQYKKRIIQLAQKWEEGTLTREEKEEFEQWYNSFNDKKMPDLTRETPAALKERLYASILKRGALRRHAGARVVSIRTLYATAAAVLLLVVSLTWLNRLRSPLSVPSVAAAARRLDTVIVPGSNRAILTLAGGREVILDSAKNGLLAQQGLTGIVKQKDGAITYEKLVAGHTGAGTGTTGAAGATATGPLYNTVTTPRGGQFGVTLPDGSKVWLNAASSIRFPTVFSGTERRVEVSGEAYFEVATNKTMPFRVAVDYPSSGKVMEVDVLGTQFNIMAYEEEKMVKTTLLEGAVKAVKGDEGKVLHPGQQAQLKDGVLRVLNNADTEDAVAWKNGRTLFAGEDIEAIMRKISRWYDVDVEYRGHLPERKFTGGIARSSDLSVLLQILQLNHIRTSIEGKKIILMP